MRKSTQSLLPSPVDNSVDSPDSEAMQFRAQFEGRRPLDAVVRHGARQMLQAALEQEVADFIGMHSDRRDDEGRRDVVRNGTLPSRELLTGAGPLEVRQPRGRDNSPEKEGRVQSSPAVLPASLRRSPSIDALLPWRSLQGISTGAFREALQSLLGENAKGLSPNVLVGLKEKWSKEYEAWSRRDLNDKGYVSIGADAIHVKVRLECPESKKQCMLVLLGATPEGRKELIAVVEGYRESEQSGYELLIGLKQRGLYVDPKVAVGDGAPGSRAALRKVFPETREQRCWVHKTANVLNNLPKSVQPRAKAALHAIRQAETRQAANQAFDDFLEKYGAKFEGACACLKKDREVLLTFYDFPAEHWKHLRTTNPIESTFATLRLRHRKTKGSGTRRTSPAMMFKLAQSAQKRWRRLNGHAQISHLPQAKPCEDGVVQDAA